MLRAYASAADLGSCVLSPCSFSSRPGLAKPLLSVSVRLSLCLVVSFLCLSLHLTQTTPGPRVTLFAQLEISPSTCATRAERFWFQTLSPAQQVEKTVASDATRTRFKEVSATMVKCARYVLFHASESPDCSATPPFPSSLPLYQYLCHAQAWLSHAPMQIACIFPMLDIS